MDAATRKRIASVEVRPGPPFESLTSFGGRFLPSVEEALVLYGPDVAKVYEQEKRREIERRLGKQALLGDSDG